MAEAAGEAYSVGDIGPAGGVVFITPSTSGNTTGYYFEVAPSPFAVTRTWAQSTPVNYQSTAVSGADGTAIGTGYQNTLDIIAQGNSTSTTSAAAYCRSLTINNYNDWFLPSKDELNQIWLNRTIVGRKTADDIHWSSSEATDSGWTEYAWSQTFGNDGSQLSLYSFKSNASYYANPVRMFSAPITKYPETSEIAKYGSQLPTQRTGNDIVYGTGLDGNVTISVNTSLSSDMYYNNLTINSGVTLNPNGFRIFVKNTLAVNGTLGIGSGVTVSPGTLSGTAAKGVVPSFSIGGNAQASTSLVIANSYILKNMEYVIQGGDVSVAGAVVPFTGGAGGVDGAAGTLTPATSGGAGGGGHLVVPALSPGGAGTSGTPGTTPPAAAAGLGAAGSGVILVVAKTITGTGSIVANGTTGGAGGSSATGSAGSAGSAAPSASLAHYADGTAHYNGVGHHRSVASPNLPHGGHLGAASLAYHGHTYRYVNNSPTYSHNSTNHPSHEAGTSGHHYGDFHNPIPAGDYYHINSIPHTAPHRNHGGTAQVSTGTHSGGSFNYTLHYPHYQHSIKGGHVHDYYARQHHDNSHQQVINRPAGTVSHVGHASYPGGAAGAAGAAGSTTAGTAGRSSGGGGIIIVTETNTGLPTTSVTGGTGASAGIVSLVLNK